MMKFKKNRSTQVAPTDNNQEFVTAADQKKRFLKWMILFGISLLMVAGALVVNYLVFIPWKNGRENNTKVPFEWNSETIFAFVMLLVLLVIGIIYTTLFFWFNSKLKYNDANQKRKTVSAIGFTAGFTDAIGVGSFGISTGLLKATKTLKDDSKLPGTLNVALGVCGLVESALFVSSIKVDAATLLILIGVLLIGVVFGSYFVSRIRNAQIIKLVMGITLFIVAILMILTHPQVNVINTSDIGEKDSLMDKPWRIAVACVLFFFFGAIQSFGIGLFAPAMASLSFLGLEQQAIFPIMSCGAALCMIGGSYNFIRQKNYLQLTSGLLLIASIFGVTASFMLFFVGLQMGAGMSEWTFNAVLKWMAIAVIFYVSISMLYEYIRDEKRAKKVKKNQN